MGVQGAQGMLCTLGVAWEARECSCGFRGTRAMGLCPLVVERGCQGNGA